MAKWSLPEGRKPMADVDLESLTHRLVGNDRVKELEDKLDVAMDALTQVAEGCEANYPPSHFAIRRDVLAAIAEIRGDQDG